jgi:hypothetical protein
MVRNVSKSGNRKGSEAKRSNKKNQDKVDKSKGLIVPDFFTNLSENSIPTDHETELMLPEAILKIAQPHIAKYDKKDPHIKTIIGLAIAAWNLPLIPKDYYQSATKKIAEYIPTELTFDQVEELLMLVFIMMKTRLNYYGNISDYIYEN